MSEEAEFLGPLQNSGSKKNPYPQPRRKVEIPEDARLCPTDASPTSGSAREDSVPHPQTAPTKFQENKEIDPDFPPAPLTPTAITPPTTPIKIQKNSEIHPVPAATLTPTATTHPTAPTKILKNSEIPRPVRHPDPDRDHSPNRANQNPEKQRNLSRPTRQADPNRDHSPGWRQSKS